MIVRHRDREFERTGVHDKKVAVGMGATLKLVLSVLVPIHVSAREDTLKLRLGVAPNASRSVLPQSCRTPAYRSMQGFACDSRLVLIS